MKIPKPSFNKKIIKEPPNSIETEKIILGTFINFHQDNFVQKMINLSFEEIFYSEENRFIFKGIKQTHDSGDKVDLITLSDFLKNKKWLDLVGGISYLIDITNMIGSSAHVEFHLRIILQYYVLRELIFLSRESITKCFKMPKEEDIFDIMDYIKNKIFLLEKSVILPSVNSFSIDPKIELREKVENVRKGKMPGVYIGSNNFDEWSGGFRKRELITIAARPGMGKTSIGIAIATKQAFDYNIKTGFFSLEMSNVDVNNRVAAKLTDINYKKINTGRLTNEELEKVENAFDYIKNSNFSVYDTLEHKNILENIIEKIREIVEDGCRIVYIDYVQLIKLLRSKDQTYDLTIITRELKALSNELNIPIIQFAQLNRSIDNRTSKIPLLSDLKQSGSIEEDSDTVIFILRPAYYRQEKGIEIVLPKKIIGETMFIVAKGRNIGVRTFKMFIDFDTYSFEDFEFN